MRRNIALLLVAVVLCLSQAYAAKNDCPRIKLKRQWGGKPATELIYQVRPIRYVIIHHTVTDECNTFIGCSELLQNNQHFTMNDLNFSDISYNFLVGNDGVVYEGRGWGVQGAHTYGYNMNGTGIAFIGTFVEKLPSRAALNAAQKLLSCGVKKGELDPNYTLLAGSQVISTQSPGLTLYNEIQDWDHWRLNP